MLRLKAKRQTSFALHVTQTLLQSHIGTSTFQQVKTDLLWYIFWNFFFQRVTVIPRELGGTRMGLWFVTLLEVSVNAKRMWLVRGVTAAHLDHLDSAQKVALVSETQL